MTYHIDIIIDLWCVGSDHMRQTWSSGEVILPKANNCMINQISIAKKN